jgi:hypothetical protein
MKNMETIEKLWHEILNHPDYVAGNIWTVKDASGALGYEIQNYLEDEIDELDEERLDLLSTDFVRLNKTKINKVIYNFESSAYRRGMWEVDFDEVKIPNLELFKKKAINEN